MTTANAETIFAVRRMVGEGFTDAVTHPAVLHGVTYAPGWTTYAHTSGVVGMGSLTIYTPADSGLQRIEASHDTLAYTMQMLEQLMSLGSISIPIASLPIAGAQLDWRDYSADFGVEVLQRHIGNMLRDEYTARRRTPWSARQQFSLFAGAQNTTFSGQGGAAQRETYSARGVGAPTEAVAMPVVDSSEPIRRLLDEVPSQSPQRAVAERAVEEAAIFANRHVVNSEPTVSVTDDGFVSLKWRSADRGVLILFPGDGTANYSIKTVGSFYATGGTDFDLHGDAPGELLGAIRDFERT